MSITEAEKTIKNYLKENRLDLTEMTKRLDISTNMMIYLVSKIKNK